MNFYSFFSRFLMVSSLTLLSSFSFFSWMQPWSILCSQSAISSIFSPSSAPHLACSAGGGDDCTSAELQLAEGWGVGGGWGWVWMQVAFWTRLPSWSGFSNLSRTWWRRSSTALGVALAMSLMRPLDTAMPILLKTFWLSMFQLLTFLLRLLPGGQLWRETSLGLQCWMTSAIMTPSAKSRLMLRLGRDRGMASTISYTSCNCYYSNI